MGILCSLFGHKYGVLCHPFSALAGGDDFVAEAKATCDRCGFVSQKIFEEEKERIKKDREYWESLHEKKTKKD